MTSIEFEDDAIAVDAALVADGLGIAPAHLLERLREGSVTSSCEKGVDADSGRYRLTFFSGQRRFRVVVDEGGSVLQRSTIDFGRRVPPAAHQTGR